MPWLKLLHLGAVVVWCGALLYLPAAIAAERRRPGSSPPWPDVRLARGLFTGLVTPAALLAIGSGTAVFLVHGPVVPWLAVKLAMVGLLVLGHAACGLLILARERAPEAALGGRCLAIGASSAVWLLAIAWLVLAKPR